MTTARTKVQARADRVAKAYAAELAEMEQRQKEIKSQMRAKKRELAQAEKAAQLATQQELGALFASLVGAATADELAELHAALASGEIGHLLDDWQWRLSPETEHDDEREAQHSHDAV